MEKVQKRSLEDRLKNPLERLAYENLMALTNGNKSKKLQQVEKQQDSIYSLEQNLVTELLKKVSDPVILDNVENALISVGVEFVPTYLYFSKNTIKDSTDYVVRLCQRLVATGLALRKISWQETGKPYINHWLDKAIGPEQENDFAEDEYLKPMQEIQL